MFIKVGDEIINTANIIRASFNGHNCAVTLHEGEGHGDIGFTRYIEGTPGRALWDYLCSPVLCTDVLAGLPAPVRP